MKKYAEYFWYFADIFYFVDILFFHDFQNQEQKHLVQIGSNLYFKTSRLTIFCFFGIWKHLPQVWLKIILSFYLLLKISKFLWATGARIQLIFPSICQNLKGRHSGQIHFFRQGQHCNFQCQTIAIWRVLFTFFCSFFYLAILELLLQILVSCCSQKPGYFSVNLS